MYPLLLIVIILITEALFALSWKWISSEGFRVTNQMGALWSSRQSIWSVSHFWESCVNIFLCWLSTIKDHCTSWAFTLRSFLGAVLWLLWKLSFTEALFSKPWSHVTNHFGITLKVRMNWIGLKESIVDSLIPSSWCGSLVVFISWELSLCEEN